jgi:hypothetical protein
MNEQAASTGRLFCCYELALQDTEMELLDKVQQFGTHTGSHK